MADTMWRHGNVLVCRRDAVFPDRCVKSNVPVGARRSKLKLRWRHPLQRVFTLLGLLRVDPAWVVTLRIGLSPQLRQRRKLQQLISIVVLLVAFGMFGAGLFLEEITLLLAGVIGIVGGLAFDWFTARILVVKDLSDRYVWLKGASPEFLAELPEWPKPKHGK